MVSINRWSLVLAALAVAPGLTAQEAMEQDTAAEAMAQDTAMMMQDTAMTMQDTAMAPDTGMAAEAMAHDQAMRPLEPGRYDFVPERSDSIDGLASEAVDHLFFLIRGVAKGRLKGANKPIDRLVISYVADTLLVSLREDEPIVKTLMTGDTMPYTREDGEVVQVHADVEPGFIDMYFVSDDGEKEMVYRLQEDGTIALESITYSEKLEEPFRYTWVYAPADESGAMDEGAMDEDAMDDGAMEPDPMEGGMEEGGGR